MELTSSATVSVDMTDTVAEGLPTSDLVRMRPAAKRARGGHGRGFRWAEAGEQSHANGSGNRQDGDGQ